MIDVAAHERGFTMENNHVLPPGPKGLPFLGNILQFRHDQLNYLHALQRTYGNMATIYIGKTPVVILFRPEHVRYILTENPRNFTNREVAGGLIFGNMLVLSLLARNFTDEVTEGLEALLGDGLLTSDGDFHHQQRRLMMPAFHKRRVDDYAGLIVQYTREVMEQWQPGSEIDFARTVQELILRIIVKILVDVDVNDQQGEVGHLIDDLLLHPIGLLEGLLRLNIDLPITPYGKRMATRRKADAFIYDFIDRRKAEKRDVGDVLSMLLHAQDEGKMMTREQVRNQLMTLIAAGHETTTNSLLWTFYLLSEHPTAREKLLAEIQTVLGGREPKMDDLPNLPYLDWVIKESMRFYPSAWTQGRQAVKEFDLDGYHFRAGTLLMFSQWALHHLPDVWGDPEVFRPERWNPKNEQGAPTWAYFPFGGGSRICIGTSLAQMEVRLVAATILQRYTLRLVPGFPVVPQPLITLRPKYGLNMIAEPAPAHTTRSDAVRVEV